MYDCENINLVAASHYRFICLTVKQIIEVLGARRGLVKSNSDSQSVAGSSHREKPRLGRAGWPIAALFCICVLYPIGATWSRTDGFAGPRTLDGLAYTLRLGKEEGPNRYAKIDVGGTVLKARVPEKHETAEDKARRDNDTLAYQRCKNVEIALFVVGLGVDAACPR